jgi:hypothetical protein
MFTSKKNMNEKIDYYYLQLLAAWGDSPLDEEEVKNILMLFARDCEAEALGKFQAFVNRKK